MTDEGIAKYILDNPDNKKSRGKTPYWFLFGFLFSIAALFTGSIKFILISFLAGSVIGVLFSYVKSRMFWKSWPYWLKGGVIGGGVTILSLVLSLLCLYDFTSPGSWGFECLPFAIPWIPFSFASNFTSLPTVIYGGIVVVVWFMIGSLAGAVIGYIKTRNKKKSPLA